jgi:putative DNA primase/helicase
MTIETLTTYGLEIACIDHMRANGVPFDGPLVPNGAIHRFSMDRKKHKKDEWYSAHMWEFKGRSYLSCVYGSWSFEGTYHYESWKEGEIFSPTTEEKEALKKHIDEQKRLIEEEHNKRHDEAAQRAKQIWERAQKEPTTQGHTAYLTLKGVQGYGIRFGNNEQGYDSAIIQLKNIAGETRSLQFISVGRDGTVYKLFLTDGESEGSFFVLGNLEEDEVFYVAEGYATAASVYEASGKPVIVAFGCKNLKPVASALSKKYKAHQMIIAADYNKDGSKNPEAIETAKSLGCKIVFPFFSPGKDRDKDGKAFTDFNDLFVSEGIEVVREQLKIAEETSFVRPNKAKRFLVEPGQTHVVADKGTEILSDPECGVFQQQGRVVRIVEFETKAKKKKDRFKRPSGALTIELCEEIHLIDALNKKSGWEKFDARSNQNKPIDFPDKAAKMILSRKGKDLPFLKGFICCPTIREDGSLLETPGYDEDTGLFFNPCGTVFPEIPENPTQNDAKKALGILIDLIKDFPFADNVSRAVALAEMITAVVRRSLDVSPGFANDASTRSSGKTLLAKLASYISTGKEPTMLIPVPNEEEMEKRIGAAFMGGDTIICIDNIDFPFESRELCVAFTAAVFNPRILGKSKTPDIATNSQLIFTGNNLVFRGDICTRVLMCRLLPDCENPEERKFDRNLEDYTPKNRGELVVAILTIIRAYIAAGFPGLSDLTEFRNFSSWTKFVRAPLMWLGEKDPYESTLEIKENDPEREEISCLFAAWFVAMNPMPLESITVNHLLKIIYQQRGENDGIKALHDVLVEFAPNKNGLIDAKVLGNKLKKLKGRIVDGYRLEVAGKDRTNAVLWKISKID